MNQCFKMGCQNEATVICKCSEEPIYCCKKHSGSHVMKSFSSPSHSLTAIFVSLNENEVRKMTAKAEYLIKALNKVKSQAIEDSCKLIDCIDKSLASFLLAIREKETKLKLFLKRVQVKKNIMSEMLNEINQTSEYHISTSEISNIINEIQEAYNFKFNNSQLDPGEVLLFPGSGAKLNTINLENFTKSTLSFSPNLGEYCNVCRICKSTYFINGGISTSYKGATYLIDLDKSFFSTLPSTSPNACAACIYKDKLVYIFGGHNGSAHSICQIYNIKTSTFNSIASLPQPSHCNTAVEFDNMIYLCGYAMSHILCFDGRSYQQTLPVSPNTHKFICSGWVVITKKLYEITKEDFREWPAYSSGYTVNYLNSCCSYNRKNYIYFIEFNMQLYRINIDSKVIERVQYS